MTPERFATEYPERCLSLLGAFEEIAERHDLVGTFSVMLASSVLIIPWERVRNQHPLTQEAGGELQREMRALERARWIAADFWEGNPPTSWKFSLVTGDPNNVHGWTDAEERPSFSNEANTIQRRTVGEVFRVLRNALAHGNIVYLDRNGQETPGNRVEHLAFLSRYEETPQQRAASETYRLVTVREREFLAFVRAWAQWVSRFAVNDDLRAA